MYAEEYLYDDADFDITDISIEETCTIDTDVREHRKLKELYKRMDKEYYSYKILHYDGDLNKHLKIELYSSPLCCNGAIRNATTGIKMDHKVGSKYDDLYFMMMDVTTKKIASDDYKNSPEDCERHQKIVIPMDIKERWMEKNLIARSKYCRL
jgi:hypothetical protein